MKKLPILSLLFCLFSAFSQTTRFVYQATVKTDSTDATSLKSEIVNLDVTPKGSIFYSNNRYLRDSIIARAIQSRNFNFNRSQFENLQSNFDYLVEKNYKNQNLNFKSRIGREEYAYDEKPQFNWQIFPETVKIGDYLTQKAQTKYGGRTWTAWFTTEIPAQDGPYKFSGLPGLIVKIEDAKGDYSFDLMQTKKISDPASFSSRGNVISVSKKDYLKQFSAYRKDPLSFMQNTNNFRGGGNRNLPSPQDRKAQEERLKANIQKSNNLIEIK